MKKALYAFAVVAMMAGVACSGQTTEEVKDSVVVEQSAPVVEEPVVDTAVVVDSVVAQ
jgi:uncharacterized protein YcfL